jgi:hypothetical protein
MGVEARPHHCRAYANFFANIKGDFQWAINNHDGHMKASEQLSAQGANSTGQNPSGRGQRHNV